MLRCRADAIARVWVDRGHRRGQPALIMILIVPLIYFGLPTAALIAAGVYRYRKNRRPAQRGFEVLPPC